MQTDGQRSAFKRIGVLFAVTLATFIAGDAIHAQPSKLSRWCGPKLTTSGDGGGKQEVKVSLPGRLILKSYQDDVWDEKAGREVAKAVPAWVLLLDYETPVLADLVEGPPGRIVNATELQLFQYGGLTRKYERFRNRHVLVTGVLNTAYLMRHRTDVYIWESRVVPIGPVGCDGKPLAKH